MHEDERHTQELRTIVYARIQEWDRSCTVSNKRKFSVLVNLLGHKELGKMLVDYTVDDANTVRLLAGPYGYTIYKMLLARMKDNAVAVEASSEEHG